MSIEEAARRMGLHPAHVRRLVRTGEIPGEKVGARWLVREDALRQRDRLRAGAGRPLSPKMAWAFLSAVGAGLQPDQGMPIEVLDDRRARHRLRRLIADAPPPDRWAAWLRRRAQPQRMWVHPGVSLRLASDPRLHSGAGAAATAADVGVGAGVGEDLVFYVNDSDLDEVSHQYRTSPDPDGQLLLMVVPDAVDERLRPQAGPVDPAIALVDLLSSPDSRQRHHAIELLGSAIQRIHPARDEP